MNGKTNRRKGHDYERRITNELKKFFSGAMTSRNGARYEDSRGIDVINTGMFNVQCKCKQNLNLFDIFSNEMPSSSTSEKVNIIFWKRRRRRDIVCIDKQDFYELLNMMKIEKII